MLVLFVFSFTIILLSYFYIKRPSHIKKAIDKIPGPKSYPVIGSALEFGSQPDEMFQTLIQLQNRYGPVFHLWLGSKALVVLCDIGDIEMILSHNTMITKNFSYEFFDTWLGNSLLTTSDLNTRQWRPVYFGGWGLINHTFSGLVGLGNKWRRNRKLITPAFHFKILEQFIEKFNLNASILIERLQENVDKPGFNVATYTNLCTLDVIAESSMGVEVNAQKDEKSAFVEGIHTIGFLVIYRAFKPWLHNKTIFNLAPVGRKYNKYLKNIQDFISEVIRNKKSKRLQGKTKKNENKHSSDLGIKRRTAFLDILLDVADSEADFSDEQIRDEVNTFMFAGHDTTSAAVNFSLYALMKHQDIQEKVVAEINEIFGDEDRMPTYNDLQSLKYLEKFVKESMRMWSPVPYVGREITEDIVLKWTMMFNSNLKTVTVFADLNTRQWRPVYFGGWGLINHTFSGLAILAGYFLPAGTHIMLFLNRMHYDPKHFTDPEVFDPERFNFEVSQIRNPYAFCPFSAGPRNCIGQKFAILLVKSLLTTILRNFKILPTNGLPDINLAAEIVLRSTTGVNIRLAKRDK